MNMPHSCLGRQNSEKKGRDGRRENVLSFLEGTEIKKLVNCASKNKEEGKTKETNK